MTQGERDALPPELERRIALLEDRGNEGADLGRLDWLALAAGSVLLPLVLILWGMAG